MITKNKFSALVAALLASMFTAGAYAQYRTVEDDGIAASPKVRQMLNERKSAVSATSVVTTARVSAPSDKLAVTASPRAQQILAGFNRTDRSVPAVAVASTTRPAHDGIAASPKLRQQLDERATREYQVAPFR